MAEDNRSLERLQRFRGFAAEALRSARKARTREMQQEYENLAAAWGELVAELERLETETSSRAN